MKMTVFSQTFRFIFLLKLFKLVKLKVLKQMLWISLISASNLTVVRLIHPKKKTYKLKFLLNGAMQLEVNQLCEA